MHTIYARRLPWVPAPNRATGFPGNGIPIFEKLVYGLCRVRCLKAQRSNSKKDVLGSRNQLRGREEGAMLCEFESTI